MKKALLVTGRYIVLTISIALVLGALGVLAPNSRIYYLAGVSLFPAAIAWFAFKRGRTKRAAPILPSSAVSLLSVGMWTVSGASMLAGQALLEVFGAPAATLNQSVGWLSVLGGLCAYWFADWRGTAIDRKIESAAAT